MAVQDEKHVVTFVAMGKTFKATLTIRTMLGWVKDRDRIKGHVSISTDVIERLPFTSTLEEHLAWRKAAITFLQPVVNAALALFDVQGKVSWSRTALCSCGCSPAWVVKDMPRDHWIDIEEVKSQGVAAQA